MPTLPNAAPLAEPVAMSGRPGVLPPWVRLLLVFNIVYILSYVDRQLLSLVVGPVKASLGLSDVQIGFLQGFGFSMVLAVSALLTARRVDTGNRTRLIALAVIAWCAMTILCGVAHNFYMLLAARTGLAVAEAVVPMAVLSLLSDVAPRASLPRAAALFMMSPYLGSGLALLFGGQLLAMMAPYEGHMLPLIGAFEPWRGLFILVGAPGILIGLLILAFGREPKRPPNGGIVASQTSVWPFLRSNAAFLFTMMTFYAFLNSLAMSIYAWTPTYMIRVHGMDAAHVGIFVGPVIAICGVGGCILGTYVMSCRTAERALSHVVRQSMRLMAFSTLPLILMPLAPTPLVAVLLLAVGLTFNAAVMSSTLTPIQLFAPPELRGRATAICSLYSSAMGGMGPLAVGALTDLAFHSPKGIAYAMALSYGAALLVAWIVGPISVRWTSRVDDARIAAGTGQA
ncbi:major facilitator superfamily MFS_1 [Rhizorhabdus wittichii RW1]|uniref:Major facilitator superfamily MFS_1 n=1 Tax=Rhizorhabdus wittichii (strain DSM 6014 / CCUG 31198 / JCM 15750 / NBRC 105917 / EY 4224 / RW1) TaxID=392499 RepID=A0A9J9HB53_RHIWR|nr:major facilitator superfamily MFS_1 [Rhizorhabdus wittichii RW1]